MKKGHRILLKSMGKSGMNKPVPKKLRQPVSTFHGKGFHLNPDHYLEPIGNNDLPFLRTDCKLILRKDDRDIFSVPVSLHAGLEMMLKSFLSKICPRSTNDNIFHPQGRRYSYTNELYLRLLKNSTVQFLASEILTRILNNPYSKDKNKNIMLRGGKSNGRQIPRAGAGELN